MNTKKRIMEEFANKSKKYNITIPNEKDIYTWEAKIKGEKLYKDGIFTLKIVFKHNYPLSPPYIKFLTKIYHPNISHEGEICLDIIRDNWRPCFTINNILDVITVLLETPNTKSFINREAAQLYEKNYKMYKEIVSENVVKYA